MTVNCNSNNYELSEEDCGSSDYEDSNVTSEDDIRLETENIQLIIYELESNKISNNLFPRRILVYT